MKNLFEIWKSSTKSEVNTLGTLADNKWDVIFPEGVKNVIFVAAGDKSLSPVTDYRKLPEVPLTYTERALFNQKTNEIENSTDKHSHNSKVILASAILVDSDNKVYVKAYKATYALLKLIIGDQFPKNSPISKMTLLATGTITTPITEHGEHCTVLMKKSSNVASGGSLCGPAGHNNCDDTIDLEQIVRYTSAKKLIDECIGNGARVNERSRVRFTIPRITSLVFNGILRDGRIIGECNFITTTWLKCTSQTLNEVIKTRCSNRKWKHTGEYHIVPLDSDQRGKAQAFLDKALLGSIFYQPMLLFGSLVAGEQYHGPDNISSKHLPTKLPTGATLILASQFFSNPDQALITRDDAVKWAQQEQNRKIEAEQNQINV